MPDMPVIPAIPRVWNRNQPGVRIREEDKSKRKPGLLPIGNLTYY